MESRSDSRLPRISIDGSSRQAATARSRNRSSAARIVSTPTACLSWKTSPARIDSMIAGVPPSSRVLRVGEVGVLVVVDVGDRAAARDVGHPVGEQLAPRHQHARGRRTADELVRGQEDGVLVRERVARPGRGTSRCRRTARRPRSPRTTARRARAGSSATATRVGDDAGDVGGGRERADLQRSVGVASRTRRAGRRGRCGRRRPAGSSRRRRSTRATASRWSGARTAR